MQDTPSPTEPIEPSPTEPVVLSKLYPDISEADYISAQEVAATYTKLGLTCDFEDVLIASSLSKFGEHTLSRDPKVFKTPVTEALYDPYNRAGLGGLLVLAKMVRRFQSGVYTNCDEIGMDLVQSMTAAMAGLTQPKRKLKHARG